MLLWIWIALVTVMCIAFPVQHAKAEPIAARQYRAELTRVAHAVYGLDAPVALFAGQIEQESGWNPHVCSTVACGLAQFTGPTAHDIGIRHRELAGADVFNPSWALRALVTYDRDLRKALPDWAFALSAYNGGMGNVRRDQALCMSRCSPYVWFGNVELKSARGAAAFVENRNYVRNILHRRQFGYVTWGATA